MHVCIDLELYNESIVMTRREEEDDEDDEYSNHRRCSLLLTDCVDEHHGETFAMMSESHTDKGQTSVSE